MRLLLVEDDNHVAAALSAILARHGFDVTHARSGEEALQALVPEVDGFSVVLDALTTDDSILAGYASQSQFKGKFKLGGFKLTNENYGIGVKKGSDLKNKINELEAMVADGAWDKAVKDDFRPGRLQTSQRRRRSATSRAEAGPDKVRRPTTGAAHPGRASLHAKRQEIVFDFFEYDLAGAIWTTVQLAVLSAIGSLIWGTLLAAMRVGPGPVDARFRNRVREHRADIPVDGDRCRVRLGLNQTLSASAEENDFETK
ncbi:hypothetical protein SVIOM342S_07992 [Streptomyces violaceorubidus]